VLLMPWKETQVFDEKIMFVTSYLDANDSRSVSDLCRTFGISRKTGHAILNRFALGGFKMLESRSHAPLHHPNATEAYLEDLLVAARLAHPTWGPKKLLPILRGQHPEVDDWPAVSTVGDILKRRGLVVGRKRRHRTPPYTQPLAKAVRPNDIWCADHKGRFFTKDGSRCEPLTISDAMSRFLLELHATTSTSVDEAWPYFDRIFREYGLPAIIRTDNGAPFASIGLGGLTRLSVRWVRLGIIHERIAPGHPEQNGRHERIHRTLVEDVGIRAGLASQQRAFDHFRLEYNTVRPHEALGQIPPARVYEPSHRQLPRKTPSVEYPSRFEVRSVRSAGDVKWQGRMMYVSEALVGEQVGFERISDYEWRLSFSFVPLAIYDEKTRKLRRSRLHIASPQNDTGEST
jgi:putative transposase